MIAHSKVLYFSDNSNNIEIIYSKGDKLFFSVHNHISSINIGIILEGNIQLLLGNKDIKIYKENQSFLILPYVSHSIKSEEHFLLINISIKTSFVIELSEEKITKSITDLLNKIENLSVIEELIKNKISEYIGTIKIKLNTNFKIYNQFIDNLRIQLETFPEQQLSIDEMSQIALSSKYHFIRLFKKNVGLTPHKFQLQNRIRKSQKLINQNFDINDVIYCNGFFDYSHFVKQFKKVVGISPTTYKKSFKKY